MNYVTPLEKVQKLLPNSRLNDTTLITKLPSLPFAPRLKVPPGEENEEFDGGCAVTIK
jgi:hypothetical protein